MAPKHAESETAAKTGSAPVPAGFREQAVEPDAAGEVFGGPESEVAQPSFTLRGTLTIVEADSGLQRPVTNGALTAVFFKGEGSSTTSASCRVACSRDHRS